MCCFSVYNRGKKASTRPTQASKQRRIIKMVTSQARKEIRRERRAGGLKNPLARVRHFAKTQLTKSEQGDFIIPCSPYDVQIVPERRALVIKRARDTRQEMDRYTLISWSEARITNHRAKHNESKRARKRGFRKTRAQIRAEWAKLKNPRYAEKSRYYKQTFGEKEQRAMTAMG